MSTEISHDTEGLPILEDSGPIYYSQILVKLVFAVTDTGLCIHKSSPSEMPFLLVSVKSCTLFKTRLFTQFSQRLKFGLHKLAE